MSVTILGTWLKNKTDSSHLSKPFNQILALQNHVNKQIWQNNSALILLSWDKWQTQPFSIDPKTGVTLILDGNIYNNTGLITTKNILKLYLDHGITSLQGLNGRYSLIIWEPQTEEVFIINDKYGFKKLYIWENRQGIVFSTSLQTILEHPGFSPKINEYAAAQFLITSHLCDESTLIQNVNIVKAASIVHCHQDKIVQHLYWKPVINTSTFSSLDACAEMMASTLRSAVHKQLPIDTPFILPISGGLDSRALTAFITPDQLNRASGYTYGHSHCYDLRIGRKIAKALGIPHQALDLPKYFFDTYLSKGLKLTDAEISIEALPLLRLLEIPLPGLPLISGYLGDCVSGKKVLESEGNLNDQLNYLWQKLYIRNGFNRNHLNRVVTNKACLEGYQTLYDNMIAEYHQAAADSFSEKATLLELKHRQVRYISYQLKVLETHFNVLTPFTDHQVIDNWLNIPVKYKKHQLGYKRMLSQFAPHLARIPECGAFSMKPVICNNEKSIHHEKFLLKKWLQNSELPIGIKWRINSLLNLTGNIIIKSTSGWFGPHNRGTFVHHDEDIRSVGTAWFRQKLNQEKYIEDWFDKKALNEMFDGHLAKKADHSIRINNIIAFIEFRKLYNL